GYEKVDVLGYSMGGGVAFQLAVQHPEMVRRLVLVSTPFSQAGFYPEMLPQQAAVGAAIAPQMKETPMYKSYVAIAPHPEDFPKLLDAMGTYMRKSYDWSAEVKNLTMPVMLIYGDSDMFRPGHEIKFYQLLGGGLKDAGWQREHMSENRLAILPNLTHYEMGLAPQMVDAALPFLNGEGRDLEGTGGCKVGGDQEFLEGPDGDRCVLCDRSCGSKRLPKSWRRYLRNRCRESVLARTTGNHSTQPGRYQPQVVLVSRPHRFRTLAADGTHCRLVGARAAHLAAGR